MRIDAYSPPEVLITTNVDLCVDTFLQIKLVRLQLSSTLDDEAFDFRLHAFVVFATCRLEAPVQARRYINTQAAHRFSQFLICGFLVSYIWGNVGLSICGYRLALVLSDSAALESSYGLICWRFWLWCVGEALVHLTRPAVHGLGSVCHAQPGF